MPWPCALTPSGTVAASIQVALPASPLKNSLPGLVSPWTNRAEPGFASAAAVTSATRALSSASEP
jgi:hypothetical protein